MLNFKYIIDDFHNYSNYKKYYKLAKQELYDFFILNRYEIDSTLDEYYEIISDRKKVNEYLSKHQALRTYLLQELVKNHYRELVKKYAVSSQLDNFGKCAICKTDEVLIIYDMDNNMNYCYQINDDGIINYIVNGLKLTSKYICDFSIDEICVLQVIYADIKKMSSQKNISDKEFCNRISNELNKARMFDNSYIDASINKTLPENITEEYIKLIKLYDAGLVSKDEYIERLYILRILSEQNVEKLLIQAESEDKEYILNAYTKLSTYPFNNDQIHIRTASRRVNAEIIKRRKKTDTN